MIGCARVFHSFVSIHRDVMKSDQGISKKEILEYLRIEEDEDTAELLKISSILHVGSIVADGITTHYWSYPTTCGVAWVSFSSEGALGTEFEGDVPQSIKDATKPREDHPRRNVSRPEVPIDRAPVPEPQWVPGKQIPRLFYFPMYEDGVSIERAAKAFSAKTLRADVGIKLWVRYFCIKLTSGRYAIIEARESNPGVISVELEVESAPTTQEYPHGYVHISDLKEILGVLGRECQLPLKNCQYQWRD